MQPNQNPYDFLNAPTPKKGFSASTQKGRIIQVAVIAGVLLLVFGIGFKLIFSADSGPKKPLIEVAAAQADIIALTSSSRQSLRDSTLKSQAMMIRLTTTTQNSATKEMLASYGVASKNVAKQAGQYQDSSYVAVLKKASDDNTYDATYQKILADKIGVYRAKLNNAYNTLGTGKKKTELSNFYNQLQLLAPSVAAKQ